MNKVLYIIIIFLGLIAGAAWVSYLMKDRLTLVIIRSHHPKLKIEISHDSKYTFISVCDKGMKKEEKKVKGLEVWTALTNKSVNLLESEVIRQRAVYDPYIRDGSIWRLNIRTNNGRGELVFQNPFSDRNQPEFSSVVEALKLYIDSADLAISRDDLF